MRVLCIATAYPRHADDAVTPWLPALIARLATRDIEVEVLTSAYRGLGDHVLDGVPVHRFRYAPAALETLTHDRSVPARLRERPAMAALVPAYLMAGTLAAARIARAGRFDVVHALWPMPHALLGTAAARAARLPLVATFFGSELAWHGARRRLIAPAIRAAAHAADVVTAISTYTARLLTEYAPDVSARVIPLGTTVAPIDAAPRARDVNAPFTLLYAGRLVPRKGVHVLLDAVAAVTARVPVHLDVVGDGPERATLESRAARLGIRDRVAFHGFVPRDDLARRLGACDAVALPTLDGVEGDVEGLGLPVLEALAAGRPVIASDSGGVVDLVRDGDTGLVVPPGDATALARAIARLADSPALARRLAEGGRAHAEQSFSWISVLDRYERAYADAIARR